MQNPSTLGYIVFQMCFYSLAGHLFKKVKHNVIAFTGYSEKGGCSSKGYSHICERQWKSVTLRLSLQNVTSLK